MDKLKTPIIFIRMADLQLRQKPHVWQPPTDLFETEAGYTVRIEIAGMKEENFSIQYNHDTLVIAGQRPQLNDKCAYHRMEIPVGEFLSQVELPHDIDIQAATAEYERGFLTIKLPRKKPVSIKIK